MTRTTRFVSIGDEAEGTELAHESSISDDHGQYGGSDSYAGDYEEDESDARSPSAWPAIIAFGLVGGWSAFFVWANLWVADGVTPYQVISLVSGWSVPVLLIAVGWQVIVRSGQRQVRRFGRTTRYLSSESELLERRLSTINRELSLAREFLASQSREMESVGRQASERLVGHAERLHSLVEANGERIDALAAVSVTALDNLEKLRGHLPVIANSSKDVANNIGNAGRAAHAQLREMIEGFNRLNEFGRSAETHVENLKIQVEGIVDFLGMRIEDLRDKSESRFADIRTRAEEYRIELESAESLTDEVIRRRTTALLTELETAQHTITESENAHLAALRERIETLDAESNRLASAFRQNEADALQKLEKSREMLETRVREALARLEELDSAAINGARQRIAAMATEAETFDKRLAERNLAFSQEFERRGKEAQAQQESYTRQMTAQIESLDALIAERKAAYDAVCLRFSEDSQILANNETEAFERHLSARSEALGNELERRGREIRQMQEAHAREIAGQIEALDSLIAERIAAYQAIGKQVADDSERLAANLGETAGRIAELAANAGTTSSMLDTSLQNLAGHIGSSREALAEVGGTIAQLTDGSIQLHSLLEATAAQSREHLPEAIAASEIRLAEIEQRASDLKNVMSLADTHGASLADALSSTRTAIQTSLHELSELQGNLVSGSDQHSEKLGELRGMLGQLDSESTRIAQFARDELSAALEHLTASTREAFATIERTGASTIAALTEKLGTEASETVEKVLRERTEESVVALEAAASRAAGVSRESAVQMSEQLAKIHELTSNLESRVAHAREKAQEQVDSDFSRRVAIITETLNSNAIDITKALSSEVTDTAWAAYLRGDRGVFTRRAVRLLDNQEARSIAQIYGDDGEFREHVSRYIHDFEAMLRQILSTRDGHVLGVTLLSSDMGKLYVVLAQSIERLRS